MGRFFAGLLFPHLCLMAPQYEENIARWEAKAAGIKEQLEKAPDSQRRDLYRAGKLTADEFIRRLDQTARTIEAEMK